MVIQGSRLEFGHSLQRPVGRGPVEQFEHELGSHHVPNPYTDAEREALAEGEQPPSFGEEHLERHLESESKGESDEDSARRETFQRQLEVDRQLTRALDLLKSWNIFSTLQLQRAS